MRFILTFSPRFGTKYNVYEGNDMRAILVIMTVLVDQMEIHSQEKPELTLWLVGEGGCAIKADISQELDYCVGLKREHEYCGCEEDHELEEDSYGYLWGHTMAQLNRCDLRDGAAGDCIDTQYFERYEKLIKEELS